MVDMMNTVGWGYGFIVLWGLHVLSVVAFFTGLLFLVVLAIKTFTPNQLKGWALWLMAAGAIVCLFTIALTGRSWIGHHYRWADTDGMRMQKMGQMMEMMKKHDGGADEEEGGEHENMMEMMRRMMEKGGPVR